MDNAKYRKGVTIKQQIKALKETIETWKGVDDCSGIKRVDSGRNLSYPIITPLDYGVPDELFKGFKGGLIVAIIKQIESLEAEFESL